MRYRYLAAFAVLSLVSACGDDPTGGGTPVETNQVAVRDNSFSPTNIAVPQGTTVTWTWVGSNQHNVTWNEQNPPNSPTQATGTYTRTFDVSTDTYAYFCSIHVGMTGSVTVQ